MGEIIVIEALEVYLISDTLLIIMRAESSKNNVLRSHLLKD